MSWAIVADSSCNLRSFAPTAPDTTYHLVPLKIVVDGCEHVDDETLDVERLTERVAASQQATSSACPSAGEWAERFRLADNVIAITISRNLSGSYEAAMLARTLVMDEYVREHGGRVAGKNIHVIDSRASGGKLELIVELLDGFLAEGPCSFEEAVDYAEHLEQTSTVLFSLSHYGNLVKVGRMPKLAGALASRLSIRLLGAASEQGTIRVIGSTRSERSMVERILSSMAEHGFHGGLVYIDHAQNPAGAQRLADAVRERWQDATVRIVGCGGLNAYYAERSGIIIGFEWA